MTDWVRVPEAEDDETSEFWSNEEYGTIVKVNDKYHALIPQTFVIGPFDDLKNAQRQVLLNYDVILKLARSFDEKMLEHIDTIRSEGELK